MMALKPSVTLAITVSGLGFLRRSFRPGRMKMIVLYNIMQHAAVKVLVAG